jgi:aspartate/methionine/tyrosine aminotransferase
MRDAAGSERRSFFSTRTSWDTTESEWAQVLDQRRTQGLPLYDLTIANPTECQFQYNEELLAPLQDWRGLHYTAEPKGLMHAREAICAYYRDHQQRTAPDEALSLDPNHIFLTASTSEAYSFLFRLLCDPGDEVLIAQPSYPLFNFLADLDDVRLVSYPLFYDYGWYLDLHRLRERITPRTRAIVVVHPNNPTGHFTSATDRRALEQLCAEFNLALIVDEVFLDYSHASVEPSFALGEHPALTFVLSGLSKLAGLPQMKLSWICALGPEANLQHAITRLEIIADTFLSVSAPMQHALPVWLEQRHSQQQQIRARVAGNLSCLDRLLAGSDFGERLSIEGGWYAILRMPALTTGEEAALQLLKRFGVVVHPGIFFGLADTGWLVLSLLPPADEFRLSIEQLLAGIYELSR